MKFSTFNCRGGRFRRSSERLTGSIKTPPRRPICRFVPRQNKEKSITGVPPSTSQNRSISWLLRGSSVLFANAPKQKAFLSTWGSSTASQSSSSSTYRGTTFDEPTGLIVTATDDYFSDDSAIFEKVPQEYPFAGNSEWLEFSRWLPSPAIVEPLKPEPQERPGLADEWSEEQVADWVANTLHLPRYSENFLHSNIDGKALLELSQSDLIEELHVSLGHTKLILHAIQHLKRNPATEIKDTISILKSLPSAAKWQKQPRKGDPTNTQLSFLGREEEYSKLYERMIAPSWKAFYEVREENPGERIHKNDKKCWSCGAACGGSGTGKTRFGMELVPWLRSHLESLPNQDVQLKKFSESLKSSKRPPLHLLLDFYNGSGLNSHERALSPGVILGLRVASAFFFPNQEPKQVLEELFREVTLQIEGKAKQSTSSPLATTYGYHEGKKELNQEVIEEISTHFSFDKVLRVIDRETNFKGNEPENANFVPQVILLQLDEFQTMKGTTYKKANKDEEMLKGIIGEMMEAVSSDRNVFVIPLLTGTYPLIMMNIFKATGFSIESITMAPFTFATSKRIVSQCFKNGDKWLENDTFRQLLATLGGVGRGIEFLKEEIEKESLPPDQVNFLAIFQRIVERIESKYNFSLGSSTPKKRITKQGEEQDEEEIDDDEEQNLPGNKEQWLCPQVYKTLLNWSLNQTLVREKDPIPGTSFTVLDLVEQGILFIKPAPHSKAYNVVLPLAFATAMKNMIFRESVEIFNPF